MLSAQGVTDPIHSMQATQAYLVGNKALAKELGAKGRHHSDEMKAAHAAASENIFQQRNLRSAASAVSNKNGEAFLLVAHFVYRSLPWLECFTLQGDI